MKLQRFACLSAILSAAATGCSASSAADRPAYGQRIIVAVTPSYASVAVAGARVFTASVTGTADTSVTWSVQEGPAGGSISEAGLYIAPGVTGTYHVIAKSSVDSSAVGSAIVRVTDPTAAAAWVGGYFAAWQTNLYPVDKIDFTAVTHVMTARAGPNTDGTVAFGSGLDPAMANAIVSRAHAAGRKAILMVGGWGDVTGWRGAASDGNRARFVTNLLALMDSAGFDGLDIDWEPIELVDQAPLLAVAQELRAARPEIILTIPVIPTNWNFGPDPWYGQLEPYFDQFNVMSYGMSGTSGGWSSWYFAPLDGHDRDAAGNLLARGRSDHPTSIVASASDFSSVGIPKSRIGIGVGFYGSCWHAPVGAVTGPLQAIPAGSTVRSEDNVLTYAAIKRYYLDPNPGAYVWDDGPAKHGALSFSPPQFAADGFTPTNWQPNGDVGYCSRTDRPCTCQWLTFEDEGSIAAKGAWVRANGYGGTIIWTLADGVTNSATGENPLLAAVKTAFLQ